MDDLPRQQGQPPRIDRFHVGAAQDDGETQCSEGPKALPGNIQGPKGGRQGFPRQPLGDRHADSLELGIEALKFVVPPSEVSFRLLTKTLQVK
jgi:hypothetical protein